jgi:hypothetical protein
MSSDYQATDWIEENEAVMKINSNMRAFFSFAKTRQKVYAKVGPFLYPTTGNPNSSPDFSAKALSEQYNNPRPSWTVNNFHEHFRETGGDDILADIHYSQEDIQEAEQTDTFTVEIIIGYWLYTNRTTHC